MQSRRELTTLTDTAETIVEKIDINYMKMQFILNITDRAFNNAYSLFVTSFNIKFSIKNSTICPQCEFTCSAWISEQRAITSLQSTN